MSGFDMDKEFVTFFLEEARDVLSDWEKHCMTLLTGPNPNACAALFRAAHNLKGSARSVGLVEFGKFIHTAEDLITLIRDGRIAPSPEILRTLLSVQSVLLNWRDGLTENAAFVPTEEVAKWSDILRNLVSASGLVKEQATAPFGIFEEAAAAAPIKQENLPRRSTSKKKVSTNEYIHIPANRIDGLMQLIGELSIHQSTVLHCLKSNTMNAPVCQKAIHIAAKLTRELQLQTMGLRLVDLSKLFQKLERTARDLAADQGKEIQIELSGGDVELDKNVIERISDPLVHMVRNAVDHGIESSGERGAKSPTASLKISAFQSAAGVTIQIAEDGRGIDLDKVMAKAVSLGLAKAGESLPPAKIYEFMFAAGFSTAHRVTEVSGRGVGLDVVKRTIDELNGSIEITSTLGSGTCFSISLPLTVSIVDSLVIISHGFSYVVPIQEISEVIDMRGFSSETKQEGSQTISLREHAVTIRPLSHYLPIKPTRASAHEPKPMASEQSPVMVIELEGRKVGFSFDRIVGQQPILIRQLAEYLTDVPGFSGNTVLANGDPALIVSPKVFARQFLNQKESA